MNVFKEGIMKKAILIIGLALILASSLIPWNCLAGQFDASAIPGGAFYLKIHPRIFVTSARFDDSGKAVNLIHVSQLSYVDNQFELYYGITNSLMAGTLLPVGYIRESYAAEESSCITKVKNPWIIIKHQFWSEVVLAASSLRVKLPITEVEPEEGLDMDDKQVDIYPVYYFDWQMSLLPTYIYGQIGYRYRMENKDQIKPSDELKLLVETGYAIVPGIVRMFTYSDYTRFFGSETDGERNELSEGYLYTIAAGVRFRLGRDLLVEVLTNANPFGRNQFRGVGGHVGIKYVLGT
jgi:hypothetical protein